MSDVLNKVLAVYDAMGRRETIQLYKRASFFEEDARCIIVMVNQHIMLLVL